MVMVAQALASDASVPGLIDAYTIASASSNVLQ